MMDEASSPGIQRGQMMALAAAFLGWMFDGLEMGLFPLVARPALRELLGVSDDRLIGLWYGVATATFLVGAATGGVLFGWLGDRIGRVRAMMLSVFTYAIFSGLCGFAGSATQIAILRFLSALGMGGEWSLGVALVMEIWPDRSRAMLAGLIGAAANFGFLIIALLGLGVVELLPKDSIFGDSGWRLLMFLGAVPALLTFFIRLFVPESEKWEEAKSQGATTHWATRDLMGVMIGALAAMGMVYLWASDLDWAAGGRLAVRLAGSAVALVIITIGYLYPVARYLFRAEAETNAENVEATPAASQRGFVIRRMLLGAILGGVALLGTWAAIQQAPNWARVVAGADAKAAGADEDGMKTKSAEAASFTQIASAFGAIIATIVAPLVGNWLGRRITYALLCLLAIGSTILFYRPWTDAVNYNFEFIFYVFLAGGLSASFYGWLPLYLPELFPTRVRATGQGFSFNFGRVIAAIGTLQGGYLIKEVFEGDYATVCSVMSLVYLVGFVVIWFAPETKGQPLPE